MQAIQHQAVPPPLQSVEEGRPSELLSSILGDALRALLDGEGELPRTAREGSSAALVLLDPEPAEGSGFPLAHYRGEQPFFPADLVRLFYLAGVYLQRERGGLAEDAYLERDILRMIRAGDVDAANLIFDRITGTLSGPELPEANLEFFARRRGRLDHLLRAAGINGTRCEQKIWDRVPYGRDAQLLGPDHGRDNRVTANSSAGLLAKIALGQLGGAEASRIMLDLLRMEPNGGAAPPSSWPRLAACLPPGSRAWGRRAAGPRLLHEAVLVELPEGPRYVLVFLSYLGEKHEFVLEPLGRAVVEGLISLE
jgi:hypothetical protein